MGLELVHRVHYDQESLGPCDYLDDEDIEYIRRVCERRLSPAARMLLGAHGIDPWNRPVRTIA